MRKIKSAERLRLMCALCVSQKIGIDDDDDDDDGGNVSIN